MTKTRGFEILSTWQGKDIHLPERKTEKSAGYDIECGEDIDLSLIHISEPTRQDRPSRMPSSA